MSCLTRYISKATPAHFTYAKVVLRYLIGIKGPKLTWCGKRVSLPHVISEILAYANSSWADDKNNRRSSMAYYLFVNNATFSWRATLSQIVVLSTTEAELMALASCCCEVVWARKLAVELGFPPQAFLQDNTGCIASANNMHLRGRSKHVALRVCFIQQLIQDGIISAKQCPTATQIADIGTKALPRVPFESFTDQLLVDKQIACKSFKHSDLPTPVCLLKYTSCFSWCRWFFVLCLFYCCVESVALLLMRLSQASKQGRVRAMFWRSDFPFLMILFLIHVILSNMSYVVYH